MRELVEAKVEASDGARLRDEDDPLLLMAAGVGSTGAEGAVVPRRNIGDMKCYVWDV